jgi:hypothetical protein
LRKLESRLRPFPVCALCNAATRGLPGGVSIAFGAWDRMLLLRCNSALCAAFSWFEDEEFVLLAIPTLPTSPSEGFIDRDPVLGLRVLRSSPKHEPHPTGRPSVTINGVGPCVSQ